MRFLLNLLIDPVFLTLVALAVALMFFVKGRTRAAGWSLGLVALLILILFVSPCSIWLAHDLEYRYPILDAPPATDDPSQTVHILVLGGGATVGMGLRPYDQLSGDALCRIVEGTRIISYFPDGLLVTSGMSMQEVLSQAELLASTAIDLGLSDQDTLQLSDPRTTREEAAAYRYRFGDTTRLVLVTSAIHLPRAMGWFHYQGLDPIPAPANHLVKIDPDGWTYHWWPSFQKVDLMRRVFHEYAGMAELAWARRSQFN